MRTMPDPSLSLKNSSAILCQRIWRGHRVRRNFLSQEATAQAKEFLQSCCFDLRSFPRAQSGMAKVYLPTSVPLVFKDLGSERSKRRFFAAWDARDLCAKNGYNHLMVPCSIAYQGVHIEEKFPVCGVTQLEQIALYEENQEKFSCVAREFAGFLCQSVYPDITTFIHAYQHTERIALGRYDNIPLLLVGESGKIVLVDLGGFQVKKTAVSLVEASERLRVALSIFPYHFEEVFSVIASFCPDILQERVVWNAYCMHVIQCFHEIYRAHKIFIEEKIICIDEPSLRKKREQILQRVYQVLSQQMEESPPSCWELFLQKIILPMLDRIEEPIHDVSSINSCLAARRMTINLSLLFPDIDEQQKVQQWLSCILDDLLYNNYICYRNDYINRLRHQCIRIHY